MAEILQGTTPSLEIKISTEDFTVDDVKKLELTFQNGDATTIYGLEDVTTDSANNSFIYNFTEAETLALTPTFKLFYQLRFAFEDNSIVGTKKMSLSIADLISEVEI